MTAGPWEQVDSEETLKTLEGISDERRLQQQQHHQQQQQQHQHQQLRFRSTDCLSQNLAELSLSRGHS